MSHIPDTLETYSLLAHKLNRAERRALSKKSPEDQLAYLARRFPTEMLAYRRTLVDLEQAIQRKIDELISST